ncbi:MAG: DNA gyrase/topoisomerase IV subunit A [Bacteroidales bacterium]|nr:DNA gyrase/topoisomerase IV subunit A [Bacteroidales bacterium]HPA69424.1 DNA gyrase/topoisomerase IV subunit A [Bacteroidales bacterium]HQG21626.1 DNA gyrase/topoisomerase IV subunit A [Bacteroidales bacterium]HQN59273.1 DNA gyrase/topoisomerase IV subunit A [Bacteroidales bacterium]HQO85525.1 DNA gyrase/topoisomerase IV subunit A [Bacteroidales bacterium]
MKESDSFELIPEEEGGGKEIPESGNIPEALHSVTALSGMYQNWFLDYASYVILERAVPHISDGLKPVQRRILYSMKRMDDGRFNKVANIIGHTMQFHPHGDASIGDALVQLGQKELLVESQGNWGNILTGDGAAAPRYIEARLSKFALEVAFNSKTTEWMNSYDGRNREPVTLPVKFPLLLAMGVEGIAVGLSSKILPHNFNELIEASINYLQGKPFELYPDFPTAGMIDVSKYNDGARGGVVKVRARIEKVDKKGLVISEIPFGRTTSSLIESIVKANDRGKIKIKKIDDNTAGGVEIVIQLQSGVSPDKTIDALYAFTDCELSISPNACVITDENKPAFVGVSDILRHNTDRTVNLLKLELEIRKAELEEEWHFSSLEKIFIEKRIYRDIEECETWEAVITAIDNGLKPYKKLFRREITLDDITRLTEIKIKRISKYDSSRADEYIRGLETDLEEVINHLANIIPYAINYFRQIRKKHGKGRERRTEIRSFETIEATKVVANNAKLYVNRQEGFIGTGLKKDEYVCDCSDIDDIIVIRKDGTYLITKVEEKQFVGKDVIHAQVFLRNDARTIYNVVYQDGREGPCYVKRCAITGLTRDKEYNLGKGTAGTKILYLSANPNGEAEVIRVYHKPRARLKKVTFDFDFGELAIKGRGSMGNILTRNAVHKITLKEKGLSTLGGRKLWFDDAVMRLNADGRGKFLGEFASDEVLLVVTRGGWYRTSGTDLSSHFEDDILLLEKYRESKIFSAVYWDEEQQFYYVKRFAFEETERLQCFISDSEGSRLVSLTEVEYPRFEIKFGGKNEGRRQEIIEVAEFIGVKSFRAKGKRLTNYSVAGIRELEPVVRSEAAPAPREPEEDTVDKSPQAHMPDDPAQMKLDL